MIDLDLKSEEDRALVQAIPAIAAALLTHLARDAEQIAIVFSLRRDDPQIRVLARPFADLGDDIARALTGAPSMPAVRVVTIRSDGTTTYRDAHVSDFTDGEETAPS